MKAIGLLAMAALATCMSACSLQQAPQSEQVSITPKVREFEKIAINAYCDVEYTQGEKPYVRLTGDAETLNNVKTTVEKGTLTIDKSVMKHLLGLKRENKIKVYITSPDLTAVSMRGCGQFKVSGKLDSDTLSLQLYGTGDIDCTDIVCDKISVCLKGTGDIDLPNVVCQQAEIELKGTGDIDAKIAQAETTSIRLKGTGDIDVAFDNCKNADCTVYGVGEITLKGSLRHLDKRIKGVGSINTRQLTVNQ